MENVEKTMCGLQDILITPRVQNLISDNCFDSFRFQGIGAWKADQFQYNATLDVT